MNIAEDYDEEYIRKQYPDHAVETDAAGRLRWVGNPSVEWAFEVGVLNLTELCVNAVKTDERYRRLYRDLGYSLSGYWEIFYWEMNQ